MKKTELEEQERPEKEEDKENEDSLDFKLWKLKNDLKKELLLETTKIKLMLIYICYQINPDTVNNLEKYAKFQKEFLNLLKKE